MTGIGCYSLTLCPSSTLQKRATTLSTFYHRQEKGAKRALIDRQPEAKPKGSHVWFGSRDRGPKAPAHHLLGATSLQSSSPSSGATLNPTFAATSPPLIAICDDVWQFSLYLSQAWIQETRRRGQ